MNQFAPIILFVYNRLDHTTKTINALKENVLADQSDLYIYADAAKNVDSVHLVNNVRNYLPTITGFKSVTIRLRDKNLGVDENTLLGVSEIINERGKVIVLEDDLVTSKWFLKFMNDGLDYYENSEDVIAINGYTYPVKQKLKEAFFLKGADCWGWATWKRGWNILEYDSKKLLTQITEKNLQTEFNFDNSYPYTEALAQQAAGNTSHWDIRWYASAFINGKLSLYPGQSLVNNIGHDASGTHCGVSTTYDVSIAQSPINVKTEIEHDNEAYHAFVDFLKPDETIHKKKGWLSRTFKKLKSSLSK